MALTSVRPSTWTGTLLLTRPALSPSCPVASLPQAQTVLSLFNARLTEPPAAIAVTPVRLLTGTGVRWSVFVPSPNCPELLAPQAHTLPSLRSASEC